MSKSSALLIALYLPLWLFVIPLILTWLPFHIYRCAVKLIAMLVRPDLIAMLSPSDARFAYNRTHMCPVSTVVPSLELEGDVDPTHIRGTLKIQILEATEENDNGKLLYPELGWTIKNFLGFPFWAKATIIDDPVRIISEAMTDAQLTDLHTQLTFQPYEVNGPLWELVIARRKHNSAETPTSVVLFRFHHTFVDGVGVFYLLKKMISPQTVQLDKKVSKKRGNLSPLRYLGMPYDFVHGCREGSSTDLVQDKKNWSILGDNFSPSEAASHLCFHISEPISFGRIRQLGALHGVSGTAVMHSAILGAIRSSVFADVAPISATVRVETTLVPPWKRDRLLGNNVMHGVYTAPVGEVDARKRLIQTNEAFVAMKESTFCVTSTLISYVLASLPRPIVKLIQELHKGNEGIFIGNIVGPEEIPKFCGYLSKNVSLMYGFGAINSGLIFGLITFGGTMRICVFGNKNLLPRSGQAEEITRAFMRELDDLEIME